MADEHEMRLIGGVVRAVYVDTDTEREYVIIDGERVYVED